MRKLKPTFLALVTLAALAFLCCSCSPQAKKAGHLQKADGYFNAGHYDEAEIEYMNVLQIEPLNPSAISRLAQIYFDQGRMGRVIPYLLKAKELQPDNLDVRLKLGLILLSTGNVKGAQDEANFILDRKPQDEEAPLLLADATNQPAMIATTRQRLLNLPAPTPTGAPVQVALGMLELKERHFPEAEAAFRRALVQNPKSGAAEGALGVWYRTQNNLPQAELAFKRSAELSSPYSFRQLAYAKFKVQNGEIEPARRALQEITAKTPDYLPALILLAEISAGEKKYPESAALLAKVLTKDPTHPEALLMNARLKLAQGNRAEAVAEVEKIIKIYPQSPQAHYQLGLAYVANGEIPKAIASLNKTLSLAPNYAEATVLLAELSLRKGDASGTIALLKPLVQQRPDIIQARFLLADAYRSQGNFNEALTIYRKLEELFPSNPQPVYWRGIVLLQQKKRDDARQAFNHALELSPDFILAVDQLVDLELVDKNYPAARQLIENQISRDPKQAGPYLLQAKTFLAQNDVTQAENSLHRAIELQPDSPLAYLLLARLYTSSNQLEKALANFRAVTAKNPKDVEALMMTGTLNEKKGDFAAAREAYEKLLVINPRFSAALNNLAYLYSEHFNQLDKAQELAQKAKDLLPHEPHTADTLGWILYKKHQYSWALTLLLEGAAKLPDSAEVQFHLGMTHYMMGEEESARAALQRAVQLEKDFPGSEEARLALSILDINAGASAASSLAKLEKMVADRPEDPIALTRLASAYVSAGSIEKAITTYGEALQKNPNNVTAMTALVRVYVSRQETAKAFELAKNARKLAPDDAAIAQLLGRLAYQSGDHPWALSLLQEAARKTPDDPETLYALGEAAYSVGQVADADTAMQRVLQIKGPPSRAEDARRFLTMTKLAANPSSDSWDEIERTLKSNPDYVPALMAQAALAERKSDKPAAKLLYEKALTIFPGFIPAKKGLVLFYAANPGEEKKAYSLAVNTRESLPNDPELAKAFGLIAYRMGDFARAASLLRESASERPQDAELMYYLGVAQSKLKQRTESRQSLQRALDLKLTPELAAEAQRILKEL